jgi:radical SAM superfamily enzyme YgiQ (UPF0313 family)
MTIINIHMSPPVEQGEKFDTLISPSGSIAALEKIEIDNGIIEKGFEIASIDESTLGEDSTKNIIVEIIENDKSEGNPTILFFSVLIYNAERTINLINELKKVHGKQIKIVVGGQLIPFATEAYLNNPNIDSTCLGDAELVIPEMFQDLEKGEIKQKYDRWIEKEFPEGQRVYSSMSYRFNIGLKERLLQQKASHKPGEEGFTQICLQGGGGPGCSWAAHNEKGPCEFCALQNISSMNSMSPLETLLNERRAIAEVNENTGMDIDRVFYVDNLFFPGFNMQEKKKWLRHYVEVRKQMGLTAKKYIYLTVGSVDEEIVDMLKDIGVVEVYLGIDHFHKESLIEQNKPAKNEKALFNTIDALKRLGIKVRAGIVLGAAKETEETLQSIREGVKKIAENYKDIINAVGVFPVEVIPGARVWDKMKESGVCSEIFEKFAKLGYLTREDQRELTKGYIEHFSESSYENVMGLVSEIRNILSQEGIHEYQVDRTDELKTERERYENLGIGKLQK